MTRMIGAIAVLLMANLASAAFVTLSWGPAVAEIGDGSADVQVTVPLYATGDSIVDAMSLGLQVQAPLAFVGIDALKPGMLLGESNDGGVPYIEAQNMSFDAFNPSTTVDNPPLTDSPMLVANFLVNVPAGTSVGDYRISTVAYAWGDYASGMAAPGGALLTVNQAENGVISVIVPEPATALLGLLGLPLLRRRRG
ncbi:MAG TPA: hypothetical protein PLV57_07185 [Phycisphaerae bacterium]|nr:hypothetical protein [Phycisphaerae bacterium]HOM50530.1 hypothetical protein [Phycisphaerae bacterium]HPP26286.1 hypothetical protein [Phycisphaerae bacterium]